MIVFSVSAEHADNFVAGFVFPTAGRGHNLAFPSSELNGNNNRRAEANSCPTATGIWAWVRWMDAVLFDRGIGASPMIFSIDRRGLCRRHLPRSSRRGEHFGAV